MAKFLSVLVLTPLFMGMASHTNDAPSATELRHQILVERKHSESIRHKFVKQIKKLRHENKKLRAAVARGGISAPTPHLAVIAACESGGRPNAISSGGTYRGKYQFDFSTWRGVGGSGDPAAAPEPEQDYRAWLLYSRRGAQPWPVCGS